VELDKAHSALVVLDLQHDIVSPQGKFGSHGLGEQVQAAGAIPAAARALEAARRTDTPVVHVGVAVPDGIALNPHAQLFAGIAQLEALRVGSEGARFVDEVAPAEGELIVMKSTVSALSGTPLDAHLRNSGISHLVLAGVATNMVIDGTTRQAVDLGYRVTILADACASFSAELHDFALGVLANLATISTVEEFVAAVDANGGRSAG
jgi:biuret amidohydrolase